MAESTQPLWILILLAAGGLWMFYAGVRIWIKRANGYFDILLGIVMIIISLFMIRHSHIYPPVTDQLEPLLAPFWSWLVEFYKTAGHVLHAFFSFDVEQLSK